MNKVIGLDLGGTFIKIGLVDQEGQILKQDKVPTYASEGRDKVLAQMTESINSMLKHCPKEVIRGIGIGTPGLVDKEGRVFLAPNLPAWDNLHLRKIFADKFSLPVRVDNDVNTITAGEYKFGAGKGYHTLICITLGTGLGGGVVIGDKLYRGAEYSACEIGHIPICYNGPVCKCGNKGCIERYVGSAYIAQMAKEEIKKGRATKIKEIVKGNLEEITPKVIFQAYQAGDELAKEIWIKVGIYLGTMFSGLVNLLNPELIIIGGGVAKVGEILFDTIKKEIDKRSFALLAEEVKVVPAKLGEDAGIVSAASLIFLES